MARRFGASPQGGVAELGTLDGDGYGRWVAGGDPATGAPRGRLRADPNAVRFVEITVNGPKTWSLAASLHPEIAAWAQNRADAAMAARAERRARQESRRRELEHSYRQLPGPGPGIGI